MNESTASSRQERSGTRKHRSLSEEYPDLTKEWHPTLNRSLSPQKAIPGSSKRAWWRCAKNPEHIWQASISYRTSRGAGCPECYNPYRPRNGKPLSETHPEIAGEWHLELNGGRRADEIGYGSRQKAWWRCSTCEHEWESIIAERVRTGGCPSCSGQTVTSHNSLASLRPDLAAQWHPSRNDSLSPSQLTSQSGREVWWLCAECGYEWEMAPGRRGTTKSSCPSCSGQHLTHLNNLSVKEPKISAEWHPELNGALTPAEITARSSRKVWWLCPGCSMEYQMDPVHRVRRGSGCPSCAGRVDLLAKHHALAHLRRQELEQSPRSLPLEEASRKKGAKEKKSGKISPRETYSLEGASTLGERVRALRLLRGEERGSHMSQADLAQKVGRMDRKDVMDIELGRRHPRRRTLLRFARALSCTISYLERGKPLPRLNAPSAPGSDILPEEDQQQAA